MLKDEIEKNTNNKKEKKSQVNRVNLSNPQYRS
jgi:hypothetical protein